MGALTSEKWVLSVDGLSTPSPQPHTDTSLTTPRLTLAGYGAIDTSLRLVCENSLLHCATNYNFCISAADKNCIFPYFFFGSASKSRDQPAVGATTTPEVNGNLRQDLDGSTHDSTSISRRPRRLSYKDSLLLSKSPAVSRGSGHVSQPSPMSTYYLGINTTDLQNV